MPLSLATGAGNAGMAVRGDDFNQSPYEALAALLLAEGKRLPRTLWEPFCGNGALVVPLRNRGFTVTATDLVERGCPDSTAEIDFLSLMAEPFRLGAEGDTGIVSNPPYDGLEEYIERAVALAPYVAFLLRFAFLESERGYGWFSTVGLRRVHLIAERLPMMHRENYDGPKQDKGAMPMAWFVFERGAPRRILQVPVRWVSYKAACRRYPMQAADTPPAAVPAMPGLLRLMAVNSGENGDTAPAV